MEIEVGAGEEAVARRGARVECRGGHEMCSLTLWVVRRWAQRSPALRKGARGSRGTICEFRKHGNWSQRGVWRYARRVKAADGGYNAVDTGTTESNGVYKVGAALLLYEERRRREGARPVRKGEGRETGGRWEGVLSPTGTGERAYVWEEG